MAERKHGGAVAFLWRRLDTPGHDACVLTLDGADWRLRGVAVFVHEGAPACLDYELVSDNTWATTTAQVRGFIGGRGVDVKVERTAADRWLLDGVVVPGLEGCVQLDFGFTPATNLPQLRRLALGIGAGAECRVAWLDVPPAELVVLSQRYERRAEQRYWYESPSAAYTAELEIDFSGFVRLYPGLWEQERTDAHGAQAGK